MKKFSSLLITLILFFSIFKVNGLCYEVKDSDKNFDKKVVYIVSRNNAEKLLDYGIKVYTMTSSFVHSKIILNENSAIVGSINIDLRSFYQQFESAVFTSEPPVLKSIEDDFIYTFERSCNLTHKDKKRNHFAYRLLAGIFNLISPFM
jgi:cardiolipin synthase